MATIVHWIKEYYPHYLGINRYPAAKCALIRTAEEEWGILGNFARASVVVNGVTFNKTEKLFQCMKFTHAPVIKEIYAQNGMGMKQKAKKKLKELLTEFSVDYYDEFVEEFRKLKGKPKCDIYLKAIEFVQPKISSVQFEDLKEASNAVQLLKKFSEYRKDNEV